MNDLIKRDEVIEAIKPIVATLPLGYHSEFASAINSIPTTKPKEYVKDGTLTIQARTIKEVNSIDRVVVYADGCQREYLMPLPTIEERKEGRWTNVSFSIGKCSECGFSGGNCYVMKYCPNCGAKMEESR